MTTEEITNINDLPPEFDLARYRGTENFGAGEWWLAGDLRAGLLEDYTWPDDAINDPEAQRAFTIELLKSPLASTELYDWELAEHFTWSLRRTRRLDVCSLIASGVWGESRWPHAAQLKTWLKHGGRLPLSRELNEFMFGRFDDLPKPGMPLNAQIMTTIDLYCADDELKEALIKEVSKARAERGIKPPQEKIYKKDIKKFHENRALPYLDLKIWAKARNREIKPVVMGEAIFPGRTRRLGAWYTTRKVDRTSQDWADRLTSAEMLTSLRAAAQLESGKESV